MKLVPLAAFVVCERLGAFSYGALYSNGPVDLLASVFPLLVE